MSICFWKYPLVHKNKKYVPQNVYLLNACCFQPIIQIRVCHVQRLLLTPSSYLSPFLKYLTCNFKDLELGLFKVIQGQRSLYQSEAHWWFPIWPLLCLTLYLSRYLRYLRRNLYGSRSSKVKGHGAISSQGGFIFGFHLASVVSVTVLQILDIKAIFPKEKWGKFIPLLVWRTCVFQISTRNNR